MVLAYSKFQRTNIHINNLGQLLLGFLEWYGNFDFNKYIIDAGSLNIFIYNEDFRKSPYILDPLQNINIAKNSYNIASTQVLFQKGSKYLYDKKILYDINKLEKGSDIVQGLFKLALTS